jgi:hypothetical protein
MKPASTRNTFLFLAMAGLALAVMLGLFESRSTAECVKGAVLLSGAGFLAGWLSHCRRPAGGGWIAGGAVAAVLVVGLAGPAAIELERWQVERGWRSEAETLGVAGGAERSFRSVDRSIHESRELERRAEAAWDRLFPLGLALAPAAFLGSAGALLAENRRRKRREEALEPSAEPGKEADPDAEEAEPPPAGEERERTGVSAEVS